MCAGVRCQSMYGFSRCTVLASDCGKFLPEDSRVVLWTMCDLSNCVLGEELVLQLFPAATFVGKYSVADPYMCTSYLRMRIPGLRNFVNVRSK